MLNQTDFEIGDLLYTDPVGGSEGGGGGEEAGNSPFQYNELGGFYWSHSDRLMPGEMAIKPFWFVPHHWTLLIGR